MDQSLSSLYPIHQIGSDGFSWWVGQVESDKKDDPKRGNKKFSKADHYKKTRTRYGDNRN